MDANLYDQIFKRKSFHFFRGREKMTAADLEKTERIIASAKPLYPDVATKIVVVPESETSCRRGAEYCILIYSEKKEDYLRNAGYIGEQIDLMLAAQDIGALWYGIGRPKKTRLDGLDYIIMIAISKMPEDRFRRDMFKSKRKSLNEVWQGGHESVGEIARFAPSACNSQPWLTECDGDEICVFRDNTPGRRGIMPAKMVGFYTRIDIGIYLYFIETCIRREGYAFDRELFADCDDSEETKVLSAVFRLHGDTGQICRGVLSEDGTDGVEKHGETERSADGGNSH